jgi:hypothetical protein
MLTFLRHSRSGWSGLKGIRAVINTRKEISILAALQSGAKEHAEERKQKDRILGQIRGQNIKSLMGIPLIYDSFTGQIWGQNFLWGV